MREVTNKLKGISCLLYALSNENDNSVLKWQPEALDYLSQSIDNCINEIEEYTKAEA